VYLKKIFWVALVLFFSLSIFATVFFIHEEDKSEVGEKAQFVERSDMKLWHGKILDKPARLVGDYMVFQVEYLTSKQEKSRISVVAKSNSRDFNIGDEIIFFQVIFTSEIGMREAFFCPVGIHHPKGELEE